MGKSRRKAKFSQSTPDIIKLYPRTPNQERLVNSIHNNPITIASGPAGTGKTVMALHSAVQLFHKREVSKILYLKPNVDVAYDRGVGFLPGTIEEKLSPLLAPVRDNLEVFVSAGRANQMINNKDIDIQLMEYIRGRSLRDTFVILDEAQNTTAEGVLTVISRLEESSILVITGDSRQKDTKKGIQNGLLDAVNRLSRMPDIVGIIEFTKDDCQRSGYLKDVLEAYDR